MAGLRSRRTAHHRATLGLELDPQPKVEQNDNNSSHPNQQDITPTNDSAVARMTEEDTSKFKVVAEAVTM